MPGLSVTMVDFIKYLTSFRIQQSGAAEACWAHSPEVDGSKPSSARQPFLVTESSIQHHPVMVIPVLYAIHCISLSWLQLAICSLEAAHLNFRIAPICIQ